MNFNYSNLNNCIFFPMAKKTVLDVLIVSVFMFQFSFISLAYYASDTLLSYYSLSFSLYRIFSYFVIEIFLMVA